MRGWLLAALLGVGCAPMTPTHLPPCWEPWEPEAERDALVVFALDADDRPTQHTSLFRRVDYLDAYCSAANRAQGIPAPQPKEAWWQFWK